MGSGKRLGAGVGNRSWERRLATVVGTIHREKKEGNKEQGLKTGAGNKD